MRYSTTLLVVGIAVCVGIACAPSEPLFEAEIPELSTLPVGLDQNYFIVPEDNPLTPEKVALGWQLYYDARLSADGSVSCASCHAPEAGFADPAPVSTGVGGLQGDRNSPTVINAAFSASQFWDGRAATLEEQALGPIENPVEMANTLPQVLQTLEGIPGYRQQFAEVFGGDRITADMVAKAIASFERTVVSGDSAWDRWVETKDDSVISEAALRGEELFRGKAGCSQCHLGFNFSDAHLDLYHNIGVGMAEEDFDEGRYGVTKVIPEHGAFKTPTLRNVVETAPYMHDGSLATLEEVIAYYNDGGEPNAYLDPKISKLELTEHEVADLVAFLEALTGEVPEFTRRAPRLPPDAEQR
jgi:cytochrome c peroxidase